MLKFAEQYDLSSLCEKHLNELEQLGNYEQLIEVLGDLAFSYHLKQNYTQVHNMLQRALDVGHKYRLPDRDLVGIMGHMAINFYLSGQYHLAEITYNQQLAIKEKERLLDTSFAQDLNTLGAIYEKQNKFEEARNTYRKILNWCANKPEQREFLVTMINAKLRAIADKS